MGSRKAPPIIQALPEPHLRGLRDAYALSELVMARHCCEQYLAIASDAARSLERAYGYTPTAIQIRNAVAPVICDQPDFLEHLGRNGGATVLTDKTELTQLALATAGTIVARYLVEHADD